MCNRKKVNEAEDRIYSFVADEYDPKVGIIKGSDSEKLLKKDLRTVFTEEILDEAIKDYSAPEAELTRDNILTAHFTNYGLCFYFLNSKGIGRISSRGLIHWLGFNVTFNNPYVFDCGDKKPRLELLIRAKEELYD